MAKRILVTGGTGLVGKGLEDIIKEEILNGLNDENWYFIGSKEGDLTNLDAARLIFQKYKPTHVVHLAAMVGGLFHNMANNLDFLRMNLQINDNVLLLSHEFNCTKVVSCLSTCIFPDQTSYPIDETMIHNGPPHSSNFGYSYAKRLIDITNKAYYEKYGHIFTSIVPCNIYGPHDNFRPDVSHVIPGMINRLYRTIYQDEPDKPQEQKEFYVYGSGKPLRQFIYSRDMARLITWVVRSYESVEPIILSVDEAAEVSIADVARSIAQAFQFKGKITFDTSKADGQFKKTASNKKLRSFLPDFEFTEFNTAIQKTVEWYINNQNDVRK
ncbi:hypothetical protein HA402_014237 [Bradysia odoriphaga]|nr:hypothetical protein HA402_014237 [Bradysia odoriphaga]